MGSEMPKLSYGHYEYQGLAVVVIAKQIKIVLQNDEIQNVELQNIELQNVEIQNIELQNLELQNIE